MVLPSSFSDPWPCTRLGLIASRSMEHCRDRKLHIDVGGMGKKGSDSEGSRPLKA